MVKLNLAQILKIPPQKTIKFLAVPLGTRVKKGEILALKQGLLAKKITVESPADGVLESLSAEGELLINPKEATAVKTKISGDKLPGCCGFGSGEGELVFLQGCLEFPKVTKEHRGKIIAAPTICSITALYKASALEVGGIVVGFADENFCQHVQSIRKISLGFLILSQKEDKKIIDILVKLNQKRVQVNGENKYLLKE